MSEDLPGSCSHTLPRRGLRGPVRPFLRSTRTYRLILNPEAIQKRGSGRSYRTALRSAAFPPTRLLARNNFRFARDPPSTDAKWEITFHRLASRYSLVAASLCPFPL